MTTIYTVNSKVLKNSATDKWLIKKETPVDPYNPLGLPPNTVRVRTSDGNAPIKEEDITSYETATLVTGTSDVYDVYKSGTSFNRLLSSATNIIEILGANATGITDMGAMFTDCTSLTSVPLFDTTSVTNMQQILNGCTSLTSVSLFDTSSVTNMERAFYGCSALTSIPLFDTSSVTNMDNMFQNCSNVESGALALYNQASTQTTPPSYHSSTFRGCGSNTTTGAAELAQIPSNWGGTGA